MHVSSPMSSLPIRPVSRSGPALPVSGSSVASMGAAPSSRDTWVSSERPIEAAAPRIGVRKLQDFEDLAQVLVVGVGGPLLGGLGALAGFVLGGPLGSAWGAAIGTSLPGAGFGLFDLVQNMTERATGKVQNWYQARVGLGLLGMGPGMALLGAGIASLVGGPTALAIGAIAGTALLPVGYVLTMLLQSRSSPSGPGEPVVPEPVPTPEPGGPIPSSGV